jgi:hypothetical protein
MKENFALTVDTLEKYQKEEVGVEIITCNYKICGTAFKNLNERFSDCLNNGSEDFIALKNVVIYLLNTNEVFLRKDYISINKSQIVLTTELA